MKLADLFDSLEMEELATGFQFTEGPVWHPDGYLLFSDIPPGIIYRLDTGKPPMPWRSPSANANGLTFDRQGHLIACEHGSRRVSITEADGHVRAVATHYEGKRLNSPNDVIVRSDGSIYFTDPPYGIEETQRELAVNGVYRIAPDGDLKLLADDFDRPNGLAFSPDEKTLYVDDSPRRQIRAFDVTNDGTLVNGRLFAQMDSDQQGNPDGMKLDVEGNIYCTGPGAVWIYRPDGELIGKVPAPQLAANLAFGGPDLKTLYLTARTSIYALVTKLAGIPMF